MITSNSFPYVQRDATFGEYSLLPYVPLQLAANGFVEFETALLDTGATVNVLPYEIGVNLGFEWSEQDTVLHLAGNLAPFEARAVALTVTIDPFLPILMAFAWTSALKCPLIMGQTNFFQEYDVCFYRSQKTFTISRR